MRIENFIAKRYFSIKRKSSFTSLISMASTGGVVLGVAALIIVLSVMNGFEKEVRERILGVTGHMVVKRYDNGGINYDSLMTEIKTSSDKIAGISPIVSSKAGISVRGQQDGIMVKGVILGYDKDVADWGKHIVKGQYSLADTISLKGNVLPGIILGKYVADRLGAIVDDEILIISVDEDASFANPTPRMGKFVVKGIFETGMYDYDNSLAYINLIEAQQLFKKPKGKCSSLEFRLKNYNDAPEVSTKISEFLGYPYYSLDWGTMHRTIFKWMKIEKWAMSLALSLIIIVAAFNIISSLVMLVMEKTRDIGVLKTIGLSSKQIARIFMLNGLYVGVVGAGLGTFIGLGFSLIQMKYEIFSIPGDVYFVNKLPISISATDVIIVNVVAVVLCLLASYYPSKRAANLDVVEAVHYE